VTRCGAAPAWPTVLNIQLKFAPALATTGVGAIVGSAVGAAVGATARLIMAHRSLMVGNLWYGALQTIVC